MEKRDNFVEGEIFLPLVRFALPVLAALFLQTMYGAVDLLIVGQFGGAAADIYVSAVATGSQVMHTLTVVITGLAMGLTVFVGIKIGAGQREEAGRIIGSGVVLFALISLGLTVLMIGFAPQLASLMNAPQAAYRETVAYILICSAGTVFITGYNLVGSIFRGIGDSKMPLITVAIACVLNIAADLLFVAVFHMGAAGAAVATVMAQAASVVISLMIIRKRTLPFSFARSYIRLEKIYARKTLQLGIPIALQDTCRP